MSEDSMLMCLIAFVLGFLVSRIMRGNGLSVGGNRSWKHNKRHNKRHRRHHGGQYENREDNECDIINNTNTGGTEETVVKNKRELCNDKNNCVWLENNYIYPGYPPNTTKCESVSKCGDILEEAIDFSSGQQISADEYYTPTSTGMPILYLEKQYKNNCYKYCKSQLNTYPYEHIHYKKFMDSKIVDETSLLKDYEWEKVYPKGQQNQLSDSAVDLLNQLTCGGDDKCLRWGKIKELKK
jgi:hypothetical protein